MSSAIAVAENTGNLELFSGRAPTAAAGVLFTHGTRVLLVCSGKAYLDLPGGVVEAGETPLAAAIREVKEELDVACEPGRLLVVDYLPATDSRGPLTAYVFDGGPISTSDIVCDGSEVTAWSWCRPRERLELTEHAPILSRRITQAVWAKQFGSCHYLENGWRV